MVFTPQRPSGVATQPQQDPHYPISQPDYPPSSVALREEGAVIPAFMVRPHGTLEPDSVVISESSGHLALDRSALVHAIAHWRLMPATENGVPVKAWHQFRVVFEYPY